MGRKISLRIRQLGGAYQMKDPTPGAGSQWLPDVGGLMEKLEEYAKEHQGDAITVIMSGIYQGDTKKVIEAMKKYNNVSFG